MVIHSPLGCSGCAAFGAIDRLNVYKHHRGRDDAPDSHVISTALGEKEVILGGEKRLVETIDKAVERYNPKIIFILSSCAAAIIGDDIDAVAEQMEKKYKELGKDIIFDGLDALFKHKRVNALFECFDLLLHFFDLRQCVANNVELLIHLLGQQIRINFIFAIIFLEIIKKSVNDIQAKFHVEHWCMETHLLDQQAV